MTTFDTNWVPLRASAAAPTNTHFISGYYYNGDPNLTYIENEMSLFSSAVPAAQVTPLLTQRNAFFGTSTELGLIMQLELNENGGNPEGGLTMSNLGMPQLLWVTSVALAANSTAEGNLIHEWGHAVDLQYQYTIGGAFALSNNNTTIQNAWTRSITFMPGNTPSGANFYGWTNVHEYWAELFRFHWIGSHGANVSNTGWIDGLGTGFGHVNLTPDMMFRGLISGPSAEPGPDDSFATAMHTFITNLTAPYAPQPIPQ